ncbi:hypothetical protein [Pseudomonas sp. BN415]|uniref:hypothetical protein n=1 Tax=Pseudomonas sp. BN415 TaxID=2567889 RepID=UPI00245748B2|nr:hypothetical protein [Pseudomonas sp. BN415]
MVVHALLLALFLLGFLFWRLSFTTDDVLVAYIRWGTGFFCFVIGIVGSLIYWYLT